MVLTLGRRCVDLDRLEIRGPEGSSPLSPREAALLQYLADRLGKAVSQEELLREVWGYAPSVSSRAVYHTVARLRQRIEENPRRAVHLVTVRGMGFRLEGASAPEPALRPPMHLPRRRTRFFGRQFELKTLLARLRDPHCVLVTLVGLGGMGKTRLAVEAVHEVASEFSHVHFVDLAPAQDAATMKASFQQHFGLGAGGIDALVAALRSHGPTLLVVDNVEQVLVSVADWVAQLVRHCAQLTVLCTSQAPLELHGEARIPLVEMPLPASAEGGTEWVSNPAAQLFADRMALHDPRFTLNDSSAGDIAAIVHRLSGWPLALELAAGQCAGRGMAWLASGLLSLKALKTAARDVAPRHHALEATLAWTWDSLEPALRRAWRHLCFFQGGFTDSALSHVLGTEASGDLVASLRQRGLIRPDTTHEADSAPRFRFLEPVRLWALQRSGPETEEARQFVQWAVERCRAALAPPSKGERSGHYWLVPEIHNLLHAFRVAKTQEQTEALGALAVGIGLVGFNHGPYEATLRAVREALEVLPHRADLWLRAGFLAGSAETDAEAVACFSRAVAEARRGGAPPAHLAIYLQNLAKVTGRMGNHADADALYAEAMALMPKGSRGELAILSNLTGCLAARGDAQAVEVGERAATLCRELQARDVEPALFHNLAEAYLAADAPQRARTTAQAGLDSARAQEHALVAMLLVLMGETWRTHDPEQAALWFREARDTGQRVGDRRATTLASAGLAYVKAEMGRWAEASQTLTEAEAGADRSSLKVREALRQARERIELASRIGHDDTAGTNGLRPSDE